MISRNSWTRIFRSLSLAFRGFASKPPQPLCVLRGLGRLTNPQESSERFFKYLNRTLIFECGKDNLRLIYNGLQTSSTLRKKAPVLGDFFICLYSDG